MSKIGRIGLGIVVVGVGMGCSLDFPIAESALEPAPADDARDGGADHPDAEADAGEPLVDYASGTRLRANVLSGEGAKLFHSWRDTELDEDCTFAYAEDGKLRCLPAASETTFFADADCKVPLLAGDSCKACAQPKFIVTTGEGCGKAVHSVGAKTAPASIFERRADGTCESAQTLPKEVYSVGLKLAATSFVEGAASTTPRADGLGVLRVRAADGAEQVTKVIDLARDAACAPPRAPALADRCAPTDVAVASSFSSSSECVAPLAFVESSAIACGPLPSAVVVPSDHFGGSAATEIGGSSKTCGPPSYWKLGAPYTESLYRYMESDCVVMMPGAPRPAGLFELADEIDADTFPKLGRSAEGTGGLLETTVLTTATNERLVPTSFFDVARGVPCEARLDDEAVLRCVPEASEVEVRYADDACTIPLYVRDSSSCAPVPKIVSFEDDGSPTKTSLGSVGAQIATPGAVYVKEPGKGCGTTSGAIFAAKYYALSKFAWSDLVVLTRATE